MVTCHKIIIDRLRLPVPCICLRMITHRQAQTGLRTHTQTGKHQNPETCERAPFILMGALTLHPSYSEMMCYKKSGMLPDAPR